MRNQYQEIGRHYEQYLGEFTVHRFTKGPVNELPVDFSIEFLTITAHYHVTGGNLGCSWYPESNFRYGLLSLPYLNGPAFEKLRH